MNKKIKKTLLTAIFFFASFSLFQFSPQVSAQVTTQQLYTTIKQKCDKAIEANKKMNVSSRSTANAQYRGFYDACVGRGIWFNKTKKSDRASRLLIICSNKSYLFVRGSFNYYSSTGSVNGGDCDKILKNTEVQKLAAPGGGSGGGSQSPSSETPTSSPNESSDPSSETPTSSPNESSDPGSESEETSPTNTWQGGEVGVDALNTGGRIELTNDDAKNAGFFPGFTDQGIVSRVLNLVYSIVAVIAVIVIIASGIMIMTSDGDQQKVATGRQAIVYACIGLVIVGSAFIITGIIVGIGTT